MTLFPGSFTDFQRGVHVGLLALPVLVMPDDKRAILYIGVCLWKKLISY